MIRAFVSGDRLTGLDDELLGDLLPQMIAANDAAVEILADEIRRQLSRTIGTGKPYRGKKRKGQIAAAADAPPVKQTGGLYGAVKAMKSKRKGNRVDGYVRIDHDGAGMNEFGGHDKRGRYHPPHPFVRPAEEIARPLIYDAIDARLGVDR
jgi:hypothetical protein